MSTTKFGTALQKADALAVMAVDACRKLGLTESADLHRVVLEYTEARTELATCDLPSILKEIQDE